MKKVARLSNEKRKAVGRIVLRRMKEGFITAINEDEEELDIKEPEKKPKDCSKEDKKHSKDIAVADTATHQRDSKDKKSKEKEKPSKEKRRTSSEVTEKEKEFPAACNYKVAAAARVFCKYLLNMKESSLSTYFDEHLAKYKPSSDNACNEWEKHMTKNRSKEHKMYDHSRIHLETTTPDESDYINASFVKFDNSDIHFIMTQYPLPDTLQDFWKMVSQKRALRVISIFEPFVDEAIEEFHKNSSPVPSPCTTKSGNDSPPGQEELVHHSRLEIVHNSVMCEPHSLKSFFPVNSQHYMNLNGWLINTQRAETEGRDKKWLSTYSVEIVADECSEAYYARVFNCATWPWKKVPNDERKLLALTRAPWKEIAFPIKNNDPVVVMCDLGLDRSATVVLTTILIELVMGGKPPDCDALFKKMRDQRAGCFTMSMYYTYAVHTALFYLKIKFKNMTEIPEDVKTMINDSLIKVPFMKKV